MIVKIESQNDSQNDSLSDTQNDTLNDTQNVGQNVGQNNSQNLKPKDRRKKIVDFIKENSKITSLELSNILDVSVSTINRDLKVMTDKKIIEYVGSAKDGYWKVNKY